MKNYIAPECELIILGAEDVIATSEIYVPEDEKNDTKLPEIDFALNNWS